MNLYYVIVKTKNEPGAGTMRIPVNASNSYEAIQIARSMYGPLLISESAMPA